MGRALSMLGAPFPYFGGKARIADRVWQALGQPDHYIEPFGGSLAVLLKRPGWTPDMTETANDADGFMTNVWRSIQLAPEETARWCNWPVNHIDLMARRAELLRNEERLVENLAADPQWCDPVLGGYWIWAASCWIGSGLTRTTARPHLTGKGAGVNASTVHIYEWFAALSHRLRRVRLICGDWTRVCGGDWQGSHWRDVGMFFDPPYGVEDRHANIYHHDSTAIAAKVMEWCMERGKRSSYRIVLAGYEEYMPLLDEGWRVESWKALGGYAHTARNGADTRGKQNRHRERLYFSPHCIGAQLKLF